MTKVMSHINSFQARHTFSSMASRKGAMADQLTTVGKWRLSKRNGLLSVSDLRAVERAIRAQLGMS